jgi:hypothetical protein
MAHIARVQAREIAIGELRRPDLDREIGVEDRHLTFFGRRLSRRIIAA